MLFYKLKNYFILFIYFTSSLFNLSLWSFSVFCTHRRRISQKLGRIYSGISLATTPHPAWHPLVFHILALVLRPEPDWFPVTLIICVNEVAEMGICRTVICIFIPFLKLFHSWPGDLAQWHSACLPSTRSQAWFPEAK